MQHENGNPVYKIGRSCQLHLNRLNSYPKDFHFIYARVCIDSISIEKQILTLFNNKYVKTMGNEYFIGDGDEMLQDIHNIIDEEKSKSKKQILNNTQNTEIVKEISNIEQNVNENLINNTQHKKSKCSICNKEYSSQTSLLNHRRVIHGIIRKPIVIHKCKKCNKEYSMYKSKWKHEKSCKITNNINNNTTILNNIIKLEMEKNETRYNKVTRRNNEFNNFFFKKKMKNCKI